MSQGQPSRPSKNGPPWWLWILLVLVTSVVLITIVATSIPDDPRVLFENAQAALESKNKELVAENLEKLRRFPEYKDHVAYLDGRMASIESRDVKALEFYEEALGNEELKPLLLEQIGNCQTKMGEFTTAISTYESAIKASTGESQNARQSLASLYYSVGAHTLTEAELGRIIEVDEKNSEARSLRGTIRYDAGRFEEAAEDFQVLLKTPGDRASADPRVIEQCSRTLLRFASDDELKKFYEENEALIGDTYLKIRLMIVSGQLEEVDAMLANTDSVESNPVVTGKSKARLAIAEGDFEEAAEQIKSVFSLVPRDRDAFEIGKQVFEKSGDEASLKIVNENLSELAGIHAEFVEVVNTQCNNVTNFEGRIAAGDLKKKMGSPGDARNWYMMAMMLNPEKAESAGEGLRMAYERLPMLVPFPVADAKGGKDVAGDQESTEATLENESDPVTKADSETEKTDKKPADRDVPSNSGEAAADEGVKGEEETKPPASDKSQGNEEDAETPSADTDAE